MWVRICLKRSQVRSMGTFTRATETFLNEKRPLLCWPLVVHATLTASIRVLRADSNPSCAPWRVFANGLPSAQDSGVVTAPLDCGHKRIASSGTRVMTDGPGLPLSGRTSDSC